MFHRYKIKDDPYYDDSDAPPIPIQPGIYQTTGSQTWSSNGKNISEGHHHHLLMPQKMELSKNSNQPDLAAFSNLVRNHLFNPSNFTGLANTATATQIPSASMLTLPVAIFPTLPPLIFTFPTFATVPPVFSIVSPVKNMRRDMSPSPPQPQPPVNLMTKQMQTFMSQFGNKPPFPKTISNAMSPRTVHLTMFKQMVNVGRSMRVKRSADYYDNIEEENDDRGSATSVINDDPITDNTGQVKIGRKSFSDCMKYLSDD